MQNSNGNAFAVSILFDQIKARGGHAAIDYKDGDLVLTCTKPSSDTSQWGRGAVPQLPGEDWVRLVEC